MKNAPTIKQFATSEDFKYLWLRYVEGFDLTHHCAKCLIGQYSKLFKYGHKVTSLKNETLDECSAKYYYLCGVTTPYRYADNLHIAFKYKEGSTLIYNDGRTTLVIDNAEKIEIEKLDYNKESVGDLPEYYTCRNWQFAYQMIYGKIQQR